MTSSRRSFLRQTGCALMGGAALLSGMEHFSIANVLAQSSPATDYKALVCVFLRGGNDGNNMIIPLDAEYASYSNVRSAAGLAISQASLLPISTVSGRQFGVHPSMPEMRDLYNQGKLAALCNVGPLSEPLTRASYLSGAGRRPYQLFSHLDQMTQWQTSLSDSESQYTSASRSGWGGRLADRAAGLNGAAIFPQVVSIAGESAFTVGLNAQPLSIPDAGTTLGAALPLKMGGTSSEAATRRNAYDQLRQMSREQTLVKAYNDVAGQALNAGQALSSPPPFPLAAFPYTQLGLQLWQVARVIQLREVLGVKRQIFFCLMDGFDTHNNQMLSNTHATLLSIVSKAMKAFYDATASIGVQDQVTAFTLSDFGRTLQPSGQHGTVGSDHAWGNHHLIMGGSVRSDFYGRFPTLALNGPDDADGRGRWIPTTSVEQYAATLASWYGVANSDLPVVFPAIGRFATTNLGFMR